MKLFLCYASPDRNAAEAIRLALLGDGHQVFFDATSLPPGSNYNSLIREEIDQSDAFIFLISPNSVIPGRYLQTELKFAKEKWLKPWGFVLPVMITSTASDLIDPYLRAVTILEPVGSTPAEVAEAVLKLSRAKADVSADPRASQARLVSAVVEWKRTKLPDPNPRRWVVYVDNSSDAPITVEGVIVKSGSFEYPVKYGEPQKKHLTTNSTRRTSIRLVIDPKSRYVSSIRLNGSG